MGGGALIDKEVDGAHEAGSLLLVPPRWRAKNVCPPAPRTDRMAAADPFTVFFTGKQDDPRHGLIVIGEAPRPVFFRFDTPDAFLSLETRTTVRQAPPWIAASARH